MEFINRNPKIIILSGKAESGKSLVASLIKDYFDSCVVISYAFYLKEYAKNVLGWDGSEDSKPREFLQQVGVELIKDNINSRMLIDRVIDDIKVYSYFFDVIVVSDARFVDEIVNIRDNFANVSVIHIVGEDNSLSEEQRNHSTETGLDDFSDYDYVIDNDCSKDLLRRKVYDVLEEV